MVYPSTHLYMTFHWQVASALLEEGQCGFRVNQISMPDAATRQEIAEDWLGFWAIALTAVPSYFRMTHVKFATIEPNGLYPDDALAEIYDYPAVVPGGGTNVRQFPLQVAHALSLTTAAERGRAHRGRVYLPACGSNLDTSDRWPAGVCQERANALGVVIGLWNTHLAGTVSVMSKIGAGTSRPVTGVSVGTRPDIQRRRANQVPEEYLVAPVT